MSKSIELAIKHKLGKLMQYCKGNEEAWEELQDLIKLLKLKDEQRI